MSVARNLKINLNAPKETVQLKPNVFMTILLHTHRFWRLNSPKSEYAFGLLVGRNEGTTRIITEAIPLMHSPKSDVVFDEDFYKHWDDVNALKEDCDSLDRCIGWYKVIERDMKFKAADIRNQVKIQTLDKRNIALLIDPTKYIQEGEYGFSIFHLLGDRMFHEMCDFAKIPWEITELGSETDKVVQFVMEMIKKYHSDKPFVEEIDETKVPIPEKKEGEQEEGDYITPKQDPNQPFFM